MSSLCAYNSLQRHLAHFDLNHQIIDFVKAVLKHISFSKSKVRSRFYTYFCQTWYSVTEGVKGYMYYINETLAGRQRVTEGGIVGRGGQRGSEGDRRRQRGTKGVMRVHILSEWNPGWWMDPEKGSKIFLRSRTQDVTPPCLEPGDFFKRGCKGGKDSIQNHVWQKQM